MHIKKKTSDMWEYKTDNNANIANFVCFRKTQMERQSSAPGKGAFI